MDKIAPEKGAIPVPVNAPQRSAPRLALWKKVLTAVILVGTALSLTPIHFGGHARGRLTSSLASSKNDWVALLGKPKPRLSGKKAEDHFLSVLTCSLTFPFNPQFIGVFRTQSLS